MAEARRVAAALLLFAVVWSLNLGRWDLWGPDEPRYAQVAREMIRSGEYLVPHLNGRIYGEKPPLFFWSVAGVSLIMDRDGRGPSKLAARLPSAIAGLGILLFAYLIGRRLYGPSIALLSMFILFSTVQFTSSATDAHLDSCLALFTTAAMFFFYEGYTRPAASRPWFLLAYAVMGLGVLTKGPVAIVVPLLSAVAFLIVKRDFGVLRRIEAVRGFAIMLGIIALWLVPAGLSGGKEYFDYLAFRQSTGRAVNAFSHAQPFYYYFDVFLADFLPWTIFLPFAAAYFIRRKEAREGLLFPFVWFAVTFLFFSLMSGKRSLYLLPLYPPAAIMIAKFCADQVDGFRRRKEGRSLLFLLPSFLFFCGLLACGVLVALANIGLLNFGMISGTLSPALVWTAAALFGAFGLTGLILLIMRVPPRLPLYLTLICVICATGVMLALPYPLPDSNYSLRPFAEKVDKRLGPEGRLKATFFPELFNYYLDRVPIESIPEERVSREIEADPGLLVLHKTRKKRISEEKPPWLTSGIEIVEKATVGKTTYYLLSKSEKELPGEKVR